MNSSVHNDYKNKDILILGEGPTQLDDTTFTAEAKYPTNFTQSAKRFVLRLHYKTKYSEIKNCALCSGNILKDFTINNMKKTALKGFFILTLMLLILIML